MSISLMLKVLKMFYLQMLEKKQSKNVVAVREFVLITIRFQQILGTCVLDLSFPRYV